MFVDDKANGGWFLLLWVIGVGFENTCTVSGKWNSGLSSIAVRVEYLLLFNSGMNFV